MNAVIYARYSSSSQDAQTIEVQLKKCNEYARTNNLNVVEEYVDEAQSARTGKRTSLQKLLKDADAKQFKYVIVYMLDRFFRNATEALLVEGELRNKGIILLSTFEPYIDNANGRFTRTMSYATAQLYSDMYSEKIVNGLDNNASKFLTTGGQRSLGFKTKDKQYYIDENEADIVRKIFEMYANGYKYYEIIEYLNNKGFKSSRGTPFNKNSIRKILLNKRYVGTYIFKGKETPDKLPRIIEDELFYKVQEKMEKNQKAPARTRAKMDYLLTTKLFCGHCKEVMVGTSGTGRHNTYYYYRCKNAKLKICDKKNVSKDLIEELVIDEAKNVLTDKNIEVFAKDMMILAKKEQAKSGVTRLKRRFSDNKARINKLADALTEAEDTLAMKPILNKMNELENEQEMLLNEINLEERKKLKITEDEIIYFLNCLKDNYADEIRYKKALINAFVNSVYLYDNYFIIALNTQDKEIKIDLPTLKDIEAVLTASPILHHMLFKPLFTKVFLFYNIIKSSL